MNDAMRRLDPLVGTWDLTMTHAWFLESMDTEILGWATFVWVGDAFLAMRSAFDDGSSDFHQRIVFRVQADRIDMRAEASEDAGQTWRKDLDYIFVRRRAA